MGKIEVIIYSLIIIVFISLTWFFATNVGIERGREQICNEMGMGYVYYKPAFSLIEKSNCFELDKKLD